MQAVKGHTISSEVCSYDNIIVVKSDSRCDTLRRGMYSVILYRGAHWEARQQREREGGRERELLTSALQLKLMKDHEN
jgi:hypothetical protein